MNVNSSEAESSPGYRTSGLGLVDAILQQPNVDESLSGPLDEIRKVLIASPEAGGPFLTVLLRTRGQRIEPLKDALLCLAAQTDQDFEVVVIDHDSETDAAIDVRGIVEAQPLSLRNRVRIVEVVGGTRSRPLNEGVREARGQYVAVFDDDDLLFADWVEQFHRYAKNAGGRILRSQAATQRAVSEGWAGGLEGFRTLSWPNAEYARQFDQLAHLLVNHSPFMTMAFPRTLFTRLGLEFDEALPVCEDWDLILRSSLLLGVVDIPMLTAIYRRWQDVSSSYTEHSVEQWASAEKRVIDRLNNSVILLPPGSVSRIRKLLAAEPAWEQLELLTNSRSWKITAPLRVLLMEAKAFKASVRKYLRRHG